MKVIINLEEFRYFQTKVGELIMKVPENMDYWLNVYRVLTREITTIENMDVDKNTFDYSMAELFIEWRKDLIRTWWKYKDTDLDCTKF